TRSPTRPRRPATPAVPEAWRSTRTPRKPATTWPRRCSKVRLTSSRRCTRTRAIAAPSTSPVISTSVPYMRCAPAEVPDQIEYLARDAMVRELMRPLRAFLTEEGVTEVVINRPGEVFLENGPEWRRVEAPHLTLARCLSLANAIATYTEQEIGPQKPILSAMLPDGERVQIVVPPAAETDTVSMSIRRPSASIKTLAEYERSGAFNRYVWARSALLEERRPDLAHVDLRLIEHLENNRLGEFLTLAVT